MAIYHMHAKTITRSKGQSATASAAYRSGEVIRDMTTGQTHDYTAKRGVVHTEILLPEGAPERLKDRQLIWNLAEASETRKNSQVAREIEIAIPAELSREKQIELVREYAGVFTRDGMIADVCIHDKDDGNPHAHIMLTTRDWDEDRATFGAKRRDWNDRSKLEEWRESWATMTNNALERAGIEERIDHRTLEAQGIDREPTIHHGNRRDLKEINNEIKERNANRAAKRAELADIEAEINAIDEAERAAREEEAAATSSIGEVETAADDRQRDIDEWTTRRKKWIEDATAERLRIDREAETIEKTAITVKLESIAAAERKLNPNSKEYDPPKKREGGFLGFGSKEVPDFVVLVEQLNKLAQDRRDAEAEMTRIENRHLASRASITTAAANEYDRQHLDEARRIEEIKRQLAEAEQRAAETRRKAEEERRKTMTIDEMKREIDNFDVRRNAYAKQQVDTIPSDLEYARRDRSIHAKADFDAQHAEEAASIAEMRKIIKEREPKQPTKKTRSRDDFER